MTGSVQVTSQTEPLFRARPVNKPVRVGLVGTGYIAEFHALALQRIAGVQLVAVADQSRLRAEAFARAWGIEGVFGSLAEMRTSGRLDAVHILTPPDTHADVAREALEADVHVLVEKPLDVAARQSPRPVRIGSSSGASRSASVTIFSLPNRTCGCGKTFGPAAWAGSTAWPSPGIASCRSSLKARTTSGCCAIPANIMLEVGVHSVAHVWDLLGAMRRVARRRGQSQSFAHRHHVLSPLAGADGGRRHGGRTQILIHSRRHRAHDPRPRNLRHGDGRSRAQHLHARPPHAVFDRVRSCSCACGGEGSALPRRPERTSAGTCCRN